MFHRHKSLILLLVLLLPVPRVLAQELVPPVEVHAEQPNWPHLPHHPRAVVELELGIDPQGHVTTVTVVQSAGPQLDAPAMAAARKLKFSPALQGDTPVAVRIRYQFAYDPDPEHRDVAPSIGRYDRQDLETGPPGFASVAGRVQERGTGRPVPGALILFRQQGREVQVVTDGSGQFRSGALHPGVWTLNLPAGEDEALQQKVEVKDGLTQNLVLRVQRANDLYRARAEAPAEAGEMTRRSLTAEEIQKVPGVYGDALKVVQNLPGVSRPTPFSGDIVVRGSAPSETLLAIEGVRVPIIYHFGGVYSVVNTDLLDAVDFLPGGYPVSWGRQLGGVLNARLRTPEENVRWHGYLELNAFHLGALLEIPLGDNTSLTLAARRSHIDVLLATVIPALFPHANLPFTLAPRYYDYQAKFDHRFSKHTSLTVLGLGSDDALALVSKEPVDGIDPNTAGKISTATRFAGGIGILRHDAGKWTSKTTLGGIWAESDTSLGNLLRFDLQAMQLSLRQDFVFGKGEVQSRVGVDIEHQHLWFNAYAPLGRTTEEGPDQSSAATTQMNVFIHDKLPMFSPAAWYDMVWKPDPQWEIVPGVRLDGYVGNASDVTLLPRLNVRRKLGDMWALKAATGLTSQRPQLFQIANTFGNPALTSHKAWEIAAGAEWNPTPVDLVDLQFFYKRLWNLTVLTPGLFPAVPYINAGTGQVIGMELLVRHKLSGRWFAWLAYTLQRSTRSDGPGQPDRLFDWDQTHILTTVANYKIGAGWEAGFRFRLVSGNPYTPVGTAVWSEQNDTWLAIQSSQANSARLPAFHQLDVRIDKRFTFDSWMLDLYLDVQNVYNYRSPEDVTYNFDYTRSSYFTGLPIIPSLGVKGEF